MGTPRFAVPSLKALAQSRHQIIAVVTNPDRPQGRGRQLASPPVKEQALKFGLEVLQPAAVNGPELAATLAARTPDLFVVVAFSVLPRHLLAIPRLGSINLHPSLLPAYRGAAPIIWAVANGEQETGITTFQLSPRIDAGTSCSSAALPSAMTRRPVSWRPACAWRAPRWSWRPLMGWKRAASLDSPKAWTASVAPPS